MFCYEREEEDEMPWFEIKVPPTKLSFSWNISLRFIHVSQAFIYNYAQTATMRNYFAVPLQQTNIS